MKGIGDLMKQAQEVQSRLTDVQNEMAKIEVTGESGAGLVQVIMNCRYGVTRVSIDSSLFGEEKQISPLQDQWSKNGLQLLMEDAGSLSKLLDASPGSAGLDVDSPLMIGRTFVEQSIGLHVTPVAQSEPV